jgi:large subunit ribosomal protein L7A
MSYEKVLQANSYIVGTKQTVKAMKRGNVKEVIIAKDADERIVNQAIITAKQFNIPITYVPSMKRLGKICDVEVNAATVAITN